MLLLLLYGCGPSSSPGPHDPPDSGTTATCPEGEVADGDRCVPERCGVGRWGGREADVFVDAGAAPGGDGTAESPFLTIGEALGVAVDRGGRVALSEGTWPEALDLGDAHDGLVLTGRCPELSVVDGTDGVPDTYQVYLDGARATSVAIAGITVVGGAAAGIGVAGGTLALSDVDVRDAVTVGVWADGNASTLTGTRVGVRDTVAERRESSGRGLQAQRGATLACTGCVIERSVEVGVLAADADLTLVDSVVSATATSSAGGFGVGVEVSGGSATLDGVVVDGNHYAGVELDGGAVVTLEDLEVTGTGPDGDGAGGMGVRVGDAAVSWTGGGTSANEVVGLYTDDPDGTLEASGLEVTGRVGVEDRGVVVVDGTVTLDDVVVTGASTLGIAVSGGDLTLRGGRVEGTVASRAGGRGVEVSGTGSLLAQGTVVDGNAVVGVLVTGASAAARLEGCDVRNGVADDGESGYGVSATQGRLEVVDGVIDGNGEIGAWVSAGGTVWMEGGVVRGTVATEAGTGGVGAYASDGGHLELTGVEVSDNQSLGAFVEAATAVLDGAEIAATRTDPAGGFGRGLQVQSGAVVRALDLVVADNHQMGVVVVSPGTELEVHDVAITGMLAGADPGYAVGLQVEDEAWVWGDGLQVDGARSTGVLVVYGATFEVDGLEVRDVVEVDGAAGHGLVALDATAEVADLLVEDVTGLGLLVSGGSLTATGGTVQGIHRTSAYTAGFGVVAQEGAVVLLDGLDVRDVEGPGLVGLGAEVEVSAGVVDEVGFAGGVFVGGTTTVDGLEVGDVGVDEQLGGGVGLFLGGDAATRVQVVGATLGPAPLAAVWWGADGELDLDGNDLGAGPGVDLEGVAAMGAAVYAEGADPTLAGNVLHDGRLGLFLLGTSATLLGNTWTGLDTPLRQQDCDGVAAPGGGEVVDGASLCDGFDELVIDVRFGIEFVEPEVIAG